jgi:hypothetical protein
LYNRPEVAAVPNGLSPTPLIIKKIKKNANEELHNLFSLSNTIRIIKSRRVKWAGHVARMGAKRNAYSILVGKPEGKRSLGIPRRKWKDNIKLILKKQNGVIRTGLVWLRIGTSGALLLIRQ